METIWRPEWSAPNMPAVLGNNVKNINFLSKRTQDKMFKIYSLNYYDRLFQKQFDQLF